MFTTKERNEFLKTCVAHANSKLLLESVCEDISASSRYDTCNMDGSVLAFRFEHFIKKVEIEVELYKPRWRFSRARGYFTSSKPRTIHINEYKLSSFVIAEMVSLFYHEASHAMNAHFDDMNCHHGSNSPKGKEFTLMYSINRYVYGFYGHIREIKKRVGFFGYIKGLLSYL